MFKNLKQYLVSKVMNSMFTQLIDSADPSCFADPLAERTEWTPLTEGGANFQTHKLVNIQNQRMEFRSTINNLLFSLVFLMSGIFVIILAIKESVESFSFSWALFGFIFVGVGVWMLYSGMSPIVFDKQKNLFWKGRAEPYREKVSLRDIHALQLASKHVSDESSYFNYELNLVSQDCSRINVISYYDKNQIRKDAASLANFLNKPLWDAIDMHIFDARKTETILMAAENNSKLLDAEYEDTRNLASKVMNRMLTQLIDSADPSCFADPLAERTEWTPLTEGGANFQTHKLVNIQNQRMEFRSTINNLLFSFVFLMSGIFVIILAIKESVELFSFSWALFGFMFAGVGVWMLYSGMSPVVFDKQKNLFWKDREEPFREKVSLRDIHALQLVTKHVSDESSYSNYELNLVLQDCSRINVISYSNKNKIRKDAAILAKFINKSLWDAIGMHIFDASQANTILRMAENNPKLLDEEYKETRKAFDKLKKRVDAGR